jgi:hypothetical protein
VLIFCKIDHQGVNGFFIKQAIHHYTLCSGYRYNTASFTHSNYKQTASISKVSEQELNFIKALLQAERLGIASIFDNQTYLIGNNNQQRSKATSGVEQPPLLQRCSYQVEM